MTGILGNCNCETARLDGGLRQRREGTHVGPKIRGENQSKVDPTDRHSVVGKIVESDMSCHVSLCAYICGSPLSISFLSRDCDVPPDFGIVHCLKLLLVLVKLHQTPKILCTSHILAPKEPRINLLGATACHAANMRGVGGREGK